MAIKVVINDVKTGKSYQKELDAEKADSLYGMKIGQNIELSIFDLNGYSGVITGGSYMTGTPMSNSIDGMGLKKALFGKSLGNRSNIRLRKSLAGNTVSQSTSQVNIKITKYGDKPIDELFSSNTANG